MRVGTIVRLDDHIEDKFRDLVEMDMNTCQLNCWDEQLMTDEMAARVRAAMEKYGVEIQGESTGEEIAIPGAPAKLECTEEQRFQVPYSYVDLNGHMNNTRYFDLAEDCTGAAAQGRALRFVSTEYVSEARFQDSFQVRWGWEGGSCYVCGEGEKPVFRMRLEYD